MALFTIGIVGKTFGFSRSCTLRGTFYTTDRSRVFNEDGWNRGRLPEELTSGTVDFFPTVSLFTRVTASVVDSNNIYLYFLESLEFKT